MEPAHCTKLQYKQCIVSGFRHEADEICALLGHYTVYSGNSLLTFQDNILVPTTRVNQSHLQGLGLLDP